MRPTRENEFKGSVTEPVIVLELLKKSYVSINFINIQVN